MTTLTQAKYRAPRPRALGYAFLALLVACVLAGGIYFARRSGADPQAYSNDFNVYYFAAHEVISGRDPYQRSIGEWTPYLYQPLLAELLVPLALLPLPLAAYVWFVINAVSIGAAAWMSADLATQGGARSDARRAVLAACALLVILRFVLDNFNLGQVNLVVAGLAVAHVYLYARDRKKLSAVALVLAASIKLTPAFLLVYHLAKLRLKFAGACVAILVTVTVISFLPFGEGATHAFRAFVDRTVRNEQGYDFAYPGNQSLRGAVARLRPGKAADPESRSATDPLTLSLSMVLLVAIISAIRARSELAAASPFFCCMVMLSPLAWKAHFVALILPIAYLLSRRRRSVTIVAVLTACFVLFNLTSPHIIGLRAAEWSDSHSLVFAGAFVIFLASLAASTARPRRDEIT